MREQGNGNFAAKEPNRTLISYTLPTNMPPASIMKTKRRLLTSCRPLPADQEQGEATDRMEDDRFSIRLGWTTQRDYSLSTFESVLLECAKMPLLSSRPSAARRSTRFASDLAERFLDALLGERRMPQPHARHRHERVANRWRDRWRRHLTRSSRVVVS